RDFHVTGVQTCALPICTPRMFTTKTAHVRPTRSQAGVRIASAIQARSIAAPFPVKLYTRSGPVAVTRPGGAVIVFRRSLADQESIRCAISNLLDFHPSEIG